MSPTSREANQLLTDLEAAKSRFNAGDFAGIAKLLSKLSKLEFTDPHQLIRFHECLLFLRAFPPAASLVSRVERLLNSFHRRVKTLRDLDADMSVFDDFDTSGIAGTTMKDILSFDVVQWLASRISKNVDIAWDDYWSDFQSERARGTTWPRFIPLLEEDADVEANIPWSTWLDAARGRDQALPWLINQFRQLLLSTRERAELYDSLRIPICWNLENLKLCRTRNWTRPRHFYFHTAPLIQRSDVSLAHELGQPAPKLEKLSLAAGKSVMNAIREIMVVRYRELYGTTLGDPHSVTRSDLGRGVVMHFWELPANRRLPLRAYLAGFTSKNGVPINYIEAIGLCEWIEVGFNTFYTYRQGETAWVYAQALRCLRTLTAAKWISIYPYQIGQNNEEAIDSGAFWFYRKLGFRPGRPDLQTLCEREEKRIAANPQYRTPSRTLKRLAEAHMFYEVSDMSHAKPVSAVGAPVGDEPYQSGVRHALKETGLTARGQALGPWDTFSIRNLGLLVNRRMAHEFNGDPHQIRQASIKSVTHALKINPSGWTHEQIHSLQNWSLVLALIADLGRWAPHDKRQLVKIIRAKAASNEMRYLRQTQNHIRLRSELLRLGSQRTLDC